MRAANSQKAATRLKKAGRQIPQTPRLSRVEQMRAANAQKAAARNLANAKSIADRKKARSLQKPPQPETPRLPETAKLPERQQPEAPRLPETAKLPERQQPEAPRLPNWDAATRSLDDYFGTMQQLQETQRRARAPEVDPLVAREQAARGRDNARDDAAPEPNRAAWEKSLEYERRMADALEGLAKNAPLISTAS